MEMGERADSYENGTEWEKIYRQIVVSNHGIVDTGGVCVCHLESTTLANAIAFTHATDNIMGRR